MAKFFEVHVEGELAAPTLHRLGWTHRLAVSPTFLRIEATPAGLQSVIEECCTHGLTIEAVVRLDQ